MQADLLGAGPLTSKIKPLANRAIHFGATSRQIRGLVPSILARAERWMQASPSFLHKLIVLAVTSTTLLQADQIHAQTQPAQAEQAADSVLEPIPPLVSRRPWPSPSLNPGVPSAYIANWGDVFIGVAAATRGNQRPDADGSWGAGFGLGDAEKAVALELSGGCGSIKQFCSNGGLGFRISRVLMKKPTGLLALAGGWQNAVQWGNEGDQDNIYSATLSYAFPLRSILSEFPQTLQINAGVGNSSFAPYSPTNSEDKVGGFASIGVELTPALGVSAGWSGRGANAQLSYTPFRDTPITINVLGADLFNQNPSGTVGVLSVTWGRTFLTPNFR